jgi:hypothetical protein
MMLKVRMSTLLATASVSVLWSKERFASKTAIYRSLYREGLEVDQDVEVRAIEA